MQQTEFIQVEQGTPEWLALRKTKITATDAPVIMGVNPWKNKQDLYNEKISDDVKPLYINERMQRGIDLEPIARDLFNLENDYDMKPCVAVKDWMMASLDGRDEVSGCILEIKCPGEKDHAIAVSGRVPDHYYPQLQHQMYVCNTQTCYYFSFDGAEGVTVEVKRDDTYIEKMIEEEWKFYDCLINKTPPEPQKDEYIERNDDLWKKCASNWIFINSQIKEMQETEEELRKQLVFLSGESNSKGGGISLCRIQRKGNVDYAKIPELKGIDLDKYRKDSISTWRISAQ